VVCLAPRAPGDSVRPRRLSGASVRPLNFTVRAHARDSGQGGDRVLSERSSGEGFVCRRRLCALAAQCVARLEGGARAALASMSAPDREGRLSARD
jgi:hypothetical protein